MAVSNLELDNAIIRTSQQLGYATIHPDQNRAIKSFVEGRDVFISNPTTRSRYLGALVLNSVNCRRYPLYHFERSTPRAMQLPWYSSWYYWIVQPNQITCLKRIAVNLTIACLFCSFNCSAYMFAGSTVSTLQGLLPFPRILVVQLGLSRN